MHAVILFVQVAPCLNPGQSAPSSAMSHKPAELSGTDASLRAPLTWGPSAHPAHTAADQDDLVWTAGESDDVKKRDHLKSNCFQNGFFNNGVHYKIGDYCMSL